MCRLEQLWWTDHILWVHSVGQYKTTPDQDALCPSRVRPRWLWVCNLTTAEEHVSCRWLSEQLQVVPGWAEQLETQVRGCDLAPTLYNKGQRELWQESFLSTINQFIGQHLYPQGLVKWSILRWGLSQLFSGLWFSVCGFFSPRDGFIFMKLVGFLWT